MKKFVFLLAFLIAVPVFVKAHPAKKVILSYENGKLVIEAVHPVKDAEDHFIDKITIWVDDKEVKVVEPVKQSSLEEEKTEIELPDVKAGSVIKVKTECNKFGSKTAELKL